MAEGLLRVTVACSPAPREVLEWELRVPPGTTVLEAIACSGLASARPGFDWREAGAGIWGRKSGPEAPVRDGDRIEVYRPLRVDPKLARRERFARQGAGAAGLFAKARRRR